jgi:hypothetical protein
MKAFSLTFSLLIALTFARADSLRAQIDASNKVVTTAMVKKDFATLSKEMKAGSTKNFKYTEAGKSQNLDEMLVNMKMGLGMMEKLTVCEAKLISLTQKGDTAVGMMKHTMVGTTKGQDKKTHTMSFTGVSENKYVNEGGKWKMASMTWKSNKQTMDGKAVPGIGH